MPGLEITIDIHEPDVLIEAITKRIDGHVKVKSMVTSDIMLECGGKSVMFERKKGNDFDNSVHSGRLQDQIIRCTEESDMAVLIIEGWKPFVSGKSNRQSIEKSMRMFKQTFRTMNLRVATFETKDNADTVGLIREIAKLLINDKLFNVKRPIIIEPEISDSVRLLCSLPQVSRERAVKLLDKYGTPLNALRNTFEWHELKIGLTKERVEVIRKAYGGD